jgi:uncharacterized protein (UPF0548 family)
LVRFVRPPAQQIQALLGRPDESFSYAEVGATRDLAAAIPAALSRRYDVDRERFLLGSGEAVFASAREALLAWRHFEIPWLELFGAKAPATPGQVVATLVSFGGLWFLNPCRVVFVDGGGSEPRAAAFAYGTLRGHAESGEERFRVFLDPADGRVWYELTAFSRPGTWATRLGYPLARRMQARFRAASARALQRAVGAPRF